MPSGRADIAKDGEKTRFKKGVVSNPNGRPVKLFSEISADWKKRGIERATPERVIEVFEYLLALPDAELREMKAGEGIPALMQMAAEEMTGKRKREILNDLLDRAHGKATQRREITGKDGKDLIPVMPSITIQYRRSKPDAQDEQEPKEETPQE